jgi:hypothetical protein
MQVGKWGRLVLLAGLIDLLHDLIPYFISRLNINSDGYFLLKVFRWEMSESGRDLSQLSNGSQERRQRPFFHANPDFSGRERSSRGLQEAPGI